jgi:hypothetical protein
MHLPSVLDLDDGRLSSGMHHDDFQDRSKHRQQRDRADAATNV